MRSEPPKAYSQNGQDKFVAQLFGKKRGGTFLEIGAFDGETYSNTAMLERSYGWQGICVEPLPDAFAKLSSARSCICVNAAAGATGGNKLRFEAIDGYGAMLSGRTDTRPTAHDVRIGREQQQHQFARRTIEVETVRAADLLATHGISTVDYVSIDVEGAELECLKGLFAPGLTVRCIGVENNYADQDVHRYLVGQGFVRLTTVGEDDIYWPRDECGPREHFIRLLSAGSCWSKDRKRRRRAAAV
jgi:FkbM family methyltransferase